MNFTAKARFKSTSQQNKHQLSVSVSVFYEKLELDEEPNITKKVPYKQNYNKTFLSSGKFQNSILPFGVNLKTGYLPLITARYILRVPFTLPLWGDVIYGWSLIVKPFI